MAAQLASKIVAPAHNDVFFERPAPTAASIGRYFVIQGQRLALNAWIGGHFAKICRNIASYLHSRPSPSVFF
ncbi:hypothetical protein BJF95_19080 [Rhizobium oryziradicis]|uniref:Uncharacterized protein n=1 Tax=Rhizobium oryziradicis TaxID=1867956 RepID=A0A1Q8ZTI1_9HYPH|nr:hypothetical protein BJF95_19080 [Rhizobium oryziradicis]